MHVQTAMDQPFDERTSFEPVDAFFARNNRVEERYAGQAAPAFQRALAERHAGVAPADCDFYHTIELQDGTVHPGDWDLRGYEEAYLGGVDLAGRRVIEFGPASGWMSAFIAARAAALTVFDLPPGAPPEFVPHPDVDMAATAADAAVSAGRLRRSWWYAKQRLGFDARAVYGDIYRLPGDVGRYDVAFFGAILLHLSSPFRALQQAAAVTDEAIVVSEVDSSPKLPGYDELAGAAAGLTVFNPTEPPFGMTHWWAVSPAMVAHMLRRLGFPHVAVTRHTPPRMPSRPAMFTVVGRRRAPGSAPGAAPSAARAAAGVHPVPPPALRFAVSGTEDEDTFLRLGRLAFEAITDSLAALSRTGAGLGRVLDFGCGVGRVARHWAGMPGVELDGTDLSADAIEWARINLPFARFSVNGLSPGLSFEDGRFGLAYALSVFTHLPGPMQLPWLSELGRVVRPGGLLYLTTHGSRYRTLLSPAQMAAFDAGEVVVTGDERPGSNHCAAFHPVPWVRQVAGSLGWTVVQHTPCGARGNPEQDSWLMRKAG